MDETVWQIYPQNHPRQQSVPTQKTHQIHIILFFSEISPPFLVPVTPWQSLHRQQLGPREVIQRADVSKTERQRQLKGLGPTSGIRSW